MKKSLASQAKPRRRKTKLASRVAREMGSGSLLCALAGESDQLICALRLLFPDQDMKLCPFLLPLVDHESLLAREVV